MKFFFNLAKPLPCFRMSFASMLSVTSDSTSSYSRHTSINLDYDNLNINYLTLEALSKFSFISRLKKFLSAFHITRPGRPCVLQIFTFII